MFLGASNHWMRFVAGMGASLSARVTISRDHPPEDAKPFLDELESDCVSSFARFADIDEACDVTSIDALHDTERKTNIRVKQYREKWAAFRGVWNGRLWDNDWKWHHCVPFECCKGWCRLCVTLDSFGCVCCEEAESQGLRWRCEVGERCGS